MEIGDFVKNKLSEMPGIIVSKEGDIIKTIPYTQWWSRRPEIIDGKSENFFLLHQRDFPRPDQEQANKVRRKYGILPYEIF